MRGATLLHRLFEWSDTQPQDIAQRYKSNGEWKPISAREYADRVYHLALFLESKGITSEEIGAIFSYNCPEWIHFELAMMLMGAKAAGLYPNSTSKDIHYILNHTDATVLAVQNREYLYKITGEKNEMPLPSRIKLIIVFDGDASISPQAVSYETAIAEGKKIAQNDPSKAHLKAYFDRIDPKKAALLIYTSGTTGNPKGALLSHDNLAYVSELVETAWKLPVGGGTLFSFLPLCHVAETAQSVCVGISQRYMVSFCTKFENLSAELPEVQPTLLLCVPRLWEKMMEGVLNKVERANPIKKSLAKWALAVGARAGEAKFSGVSLTSADELQLKLAEKLVLGKIKHALGLSKATLLASGAAALAPHITRWFRCLGLEIVEDFGQTETSAIICMTVPGVDCAGTVGKPVKGTDFKIAEDGEIFTRGRHVFVGYHKDAEATVQVLDSEGWLHTGDLGQFDDRGMVKILGRKKEILKTSGGKMVAPVPIEEDLKVSGIVGQVCIVGDGRKYLSALVTLPEMRLAELRKSGANLSERVFKNAGIEAEVKATFDSVNRNLASYEQIKRFTILSREFSVADGEMTPTLKMKRNVIEARFKDLIDQMYE